MKAIVPAMLAAIALAGPAAAMADTKTAGSGSKPSSYAPGPHNSRHVYGSPIEPPITGHTVAPRHARAHKKQSTSAARRRAQPDPR